MNTITTPMSPNHSTDNLRAVESLRQREAAAGALALFEHFLRSEPDHTFLDRPSELAKAYRDHLWYRLNTTFDGMLLWGKNGASSPAAISPAEGVRFFSHVVRTRIRVAVGILPGLSIVLRAANCLAGAAIAALVFTASSAFVTELWLHLQK